MFNEEEVAFMFVHLKLLQGKIKNQFNDYENKILSDILEKLEKYKRGEI